MPPNAQPACSEDMIGRPSVLLDLARRGCSSTTSCVALAPPSTTSPSGDEQRVRREHGQVDRERRRRSRRPRRSARSRGARSPGRRSGRARMTASAIPTMHEAHRALGEVEALLHPRDLRDPGADRGAVDDEDAGRGPARRHARVTLTPSGAVGVEQLVGRGGLGDEVGELGDRRDDVRAAGAELVGGRERDHVGRRVDHRALDVRLVEVVGASARPRGAARRRRARRRRRGSGG